MSCNVLIRPIICLFTSEYQGVQWRKLICDNAANKQNVGQIRKVITEVVEQFRELNPEALTCRNGDKVMKPRWQLEKEARNREEWARMTPEEREATMELQR